MVIRFVVASLLFARLLSAQDWPAHGGDPAGTRFSPLKQIDKSNVAKLERAWIFDTGDSFPRSEMQCQPIVWRGVLYATTPKLNVIALDGATGKLIWRFDPHGGKPNSRTWRNRGLMLWTDGDDARVYVAVGPRFYALDARSGKPVKTFGDGGSIDLREGLGRDPETLSLSLTTPGAVYRDLLILGGITSEDLPAAPGDIRAFDARTGKLRWQFHTIPRPGEFGYETWPKDAWTRTGGANSWAGMALDVTRGLVFVPTGSAAFDFYGADRHGDNLFANCLLALDAATGERRWHFQFTRHDVWDRDLPSAPTLVTVLRNGRKVDAVSQTTKSGHVFVFERETGKPLFPIELRRTEPSDVPGEQLSTVQALPLKPPPFARQQLTEELLTDRTPEARAAVLAKLRMVRSNGQFTPPSIQGTVIFPGFDGGAEWGGSAFDASTGLLFVNSNEMPWILRLVERKELKRRTTGKQLYESQCASCHKADRSGSNEFPSLIGIGERRRHQEIADVIRKGAGRMPAFAKLPSDAVDALVAFLARGEDKELQLADNTRANGLRFYHDGYNRFLDPDGYPAVKPPWGTLNAIDLNKGEIRWQVPLGEIPELAAKGFRNTGTENYGGPVVTATGLVFIGASNYDRTFRAFDSDNGKVLWSAELPAGGNATPAIYEAEGRQFVVIAAGGGKSGQPSGGTYVAFALPTSAKLATSTGERESPRGPRRVD